MAETYLPPGLMPSLKDRLLDPDSMGTRGHPGYMMHQYLESVREDLEELLNSRRSHRDLESEYPEVARSIVTYGLPDLASMDTSTPGRREAIGQIMEKSITTHEPRLRNVRATQTRGSALDLRALFHVDAELRVDPAPAVFFETLVELTTGHASVRERTG